MRAFSLGLLTALILCRTFLLIFLLQLSTMMPAPQSLLLSSWYRSQLDFGKEGRERREEERGGGGGGGGGILDSKQHTSIGSVCGTVSMGEYKYHDHMTNVQKSCDCTYSTFMFTALQRHWHTSKQTNKQMDVLKDLKKSFYSRPP